MASNSIGELFPGLYLDSFDHVLDAQGRVSLPSEWRNRDGETEMVLLPTADKALVLLPLEVFMEFVKKAAKKAIANPNIQRALAHLGSKSSRCRCDKQGRMALKRSMLDSIGVGKTVKLIGAVNHIRICAPENWNPSENSAEYLSEIQAISDGNDNIDELGSMLQGVFGK